MARCKSLLSPGPFVSSAIFDSGSPEASRRRAHIEAKRQNVALPLTGTLRRASDAREGFERGSFAGVWARL
jgi:hypothetical protein